MQAPVQTYRYSKRKLLILYALAVLGNFVFFLLDEYPSFVLPIIFGAVVAFSGGILVCIAAYGMRYELSEETFTCFIFGVQIQLVRNRMRFVYPLFWVNFWLEEKVTRGMPFTSILCYNWLLESPIDTASLIKPDVPESSNPVPPHEQAS
jgi:hypothetical protein